MTSRLFNSSTLGRLFGFALVVIFFALLASPYIRQPAGAEPDPAGPTTPTATPMDQERAGAPVVPVEDSFVGDGLSVAFAARPTGDTADLTEVSFRLVDEATGQPVTPSTPPAVWISRQQAPTGSSAADASSCQDRIRAYAQGTFDMRPEIDLTSYFVTALNDDASISVIDPLNGVAGISQLFAMVLLASPGEDWVTTGDGTRLFVSMPQIGQVAAVDTEDFGVISNIDVGGTPVRLALHPDGRSLWVTNDSEDGTLGGVTVIDVATLEVVARLATGLGPHEIVFSGEVAASHGHGPEASSGTAGTATYAFVANRRDGTVSVVDTQAMELDTTVDASAPITGLDYASASNAVYVAGEGDAGLTVIDASRHEIVASIATSPGVESIRFAPGGRWGFAVSAASDSVDVIDATTNRVVHTVQVRGAPDRVSFNATHAYVHASERPDVAVIELAHLGGRETLEAVTVIGGEMPPVQSPVQLSVADPIVSVHAHGGHVLIANPGDKSIYYYMAGMNAPMQAFTNYGRSPRAVGVIDRSMRETAPGVYSARVRVPGSGQYQVAFLLDDPRVVHCFTFTAGPDPTAADGAGEGPLTLRVLSAGSGAKAGGAKAGEAKAGEPLAVRVAIVDSRGEPAPGIADLQVLATLASGQRSERFGAVAAGDPGTYEARVVLADPGAYTLYFAIPSRGAGAGDLASFPLRVTP